MELTVLVLVEPIPGEALAGRRVGIRHVDWRVWGSVQSAVDYRRPLLATDTLGRGPLLVEGARESGLAFHPPTQAGQASTPDGDFLRHTQYTTQRCSLARLYENTIE